MGCRFAQPGTREKAGLLWVTERSWSHTVVRHPRTVHWRTPSSSVECGLGTRVVVLSGVSDPLKMEDPAFVAAARAAGVLLSLGGDEKASLEALEEQVADRIAHHEGAVDLRVAFGKPQEAIVREAGQEPCGLIVMGSRGPGASRACLAA